MAEIAQRIGCGLTLSSTQAPIGTAVSAARQSAPMRRQSTSRAAGGTKGTASASSMRRLIGTAVAGP